MDAVDRYKERRRKRIEERVGRPVDVVEDFKKRRNERLREDGRWMGWVWGALKKEGVDPSGMDLNEALEKWNEINGKDGKGKEKKEGSSESKNQNNTSNKNIKKSDPKNDRKKQECDGSEYKGKAGEVTTGKNGNLKPKSEISKRVETKDCMDELKLWETSGHKKGLPRNSMSDFVDEDGNLMPERQKVHDEIVQKIFKDKVPYDGKATMIMSGGGPASGKSFISDAANKKFGEEYVFKVDPDEIKAMLPGYADMAVKGKKAAGFYHEESSALAKRIYQYALDNNLNVVYDGTGDGSVNSVKKKIDQARKAGYGVRGEYVTVNVNGDSGALVRNKKRYEHDLRDWKSGKQDMDPPRLVGTKHVRDIHKKVSDIAPDVANLFDEWVLTDNNVPRGAERPVIATCKKGGEIKVVPGMERKVLNWLKKGSRGGRVKNGGIVFPDAVK